MEVDLCEDKKATKHMKIRKEHTLISNKARKVNYRELSNPEVTS